VAVVDALLVLKVQLQYWLLLRLRLRCLVDNCVFLDRTAIPLVITIGLHFMLITVINIVLP
jgi:hypothetical protein